MGQFILVFYKLENGFARNIKVVETSNSRNRLIYIAESARYNNYKEEGYIYNVFQNVGSKYEEDND